MFVCMCVYMCVYFVSYAHDLFVSILGESLSHINIAALRLIILVLYIPVPLGGHVLLEDDGKLKPLTGITLDAWHKGTHIRIVIIIY